MTSDSAAGARIRVGPAGTTPGTVVPRPAGPGRGAAATDLVGRRHDPSGGHRAPSYMSPIGLFRRLQSGHVRVRLQLACARPVTGTRAHRVHCRTELGRLKPPAAPSRGHCVLRPATWHRCDKTSRQSVRVVGRRTPGLSPPSASPWHRYGADVFRARTTGCFRRW